MFDGRSETRLTQNGGAQLLRREQAGAQNLEHHRALQQRVVGQVHHAAAAGAEAANDLVVLDGLSFHRCFKCSCSVDEDCINFR